MLTVTVNGQTYQIKTSDTDRVEFKILWVLMDIKDDG